MKTQLTIVAMTVAAALIGPGAYAGHTGHAGHAGRAGRAGHDRPDAEATSYLLIDALSGRVLDQSWVAPATPVPIGSLIKPFTALAYAEAHRFTYPAFTCRGAADRCWLPAGHGEVTIAPAIADSCNAYFHQLSQQTTAEHLTTTLRWFGMRAPDAGLTRASLVGLGDALRLTPAMVVHGYRELLARATQPGVAPLVEGMMASGRTGTGRGAGESLGRDVLAKTGTAPCLHASRASGDGYTVLAYPVDRPRLILLVQVHGRTGAETAGVAGRLLRQAIEVR